MPVRRARVEAELASATNIRRRAREASQAYLRRLASAVASGLTEYEWQRLSTEGQNWVNASVAAMNAKRPLPMPPGSLGKSYMRRREMQKAEGIWATTKTWALRYPDCNGVEIQTKMLAEGLAAPTIATIKAVIKEVRHTSRLLIELGIMNEQALQQWRDTYAEGRREADTGRNAKGARHSRTSACQNTGG